MVADLSKLNRRDFLRAGLVFGAGASGLAAGYAAVPDIFARAVYAAKEEKIVNDKVLLMIQLAGAPRVRNTLTRSVCSVRNDAAAATASPRSNAAVAPPSSPSRRADSEARRSWTANCGSGGSRPTPRRLIDSWSERAPARFT